MKDAERRTADPLIDEVRRIRRSILPWVAQIIERRMMRQQRQVADRRGKRANNASRGQHGVASVQHHRVKPPQFFGHRQAIYLS